MQNFLKIVKKSKKEVNNVIFRYRNNIGDREELAHLIMNCFYEKILNSIRRHLGHHDYDLAGEVASQIILDWVERDNINNFYNYISSNISYYVRNYKDNELYKGLSAWQIRKFQGMIKKKKKGLDLTTKEQKLYNKYEGLRVREVYISDLKKEIGEDEEGFRSIWE